MERRRFIKSGLMAGAGLTSGGWARSAGLGESDVGGSGFRMKFSGEFDMFESAGPGWEEQLEWGYDQGFRAWEHTWLRRKSREEQERIARKLGRLGMEFGQFVGTMSFKEVTFAGRDREIRERVLEEVRESVEIAKRMNTKYIHNVLGRADANLPWDFQMANAIELLKRVAEIYEPHGLVMVMETMNHKINHAGMFLHRVPQAYALAKGVDSPSVKLLFDVYHVQIQEGNLIPTLDYAWDEIAYFQLGDTPGRFEPGTGEIHYGNVLQHVWDKGYRGFLGLEHKVKGEGKEGDAKVIETYRDIDKVAWD